MERSSGAAPPRRPARASERAVGGLLSVEVERFGEGTPVIALAGELELSTVAGLEPRLFEELCSRATVVLDLTRLSFIDSSGIGLLIKAHRSADGGLHTVIASGSQVERVFALLGIDQALPLFLVRDAAVAALNGRPAG